MRRYRDSIATVAIWGEKNANFQCPCGGAGLRRLARLASFLWDANQLLRRMHNNWRDKIARDYPTQWWTRTLKKRIDNPALITPAYEDRGLFKKPPTELVVKLIPKFGKNSRGDVIIKGLVQNDVEVDIVFAGRRKKQADELVTLLRRKWDNANYMAPNGGARPTRSDVRLPTRVQGSWRTRVVEDEDALFSKEYQLLVSRWAFNSESGELRSFGEPPFSEQSVTAASGDQRD